MTGRGGSAGPLVFLVAGEPSGDQLGARLMAALRTETGGRVRFAGLGGERMAAEGLDPLFPIDELAVMGLVEVLPHARRILRRVRETAAAARAARPDALVTIDSPSFSLRVSRRLRGAGFPLIHYVAPSVWAWRPGRARRMARYLDHLLALLPFEPPYFEMHGLATTVVGHPLVELVDRPSDPDAFRARHDISPDAPLLTVLPGSRKVEVERLLPVFRDAVADLTADLPTLRVVIPTVSTVGEVVARAVADWPVPAVIVEQTEDKFDAFSAAHAALAASGTVAVEAAVAGLPTVVGYRVAPISAAIARRLIRVRFASIVNLVLDREVQPEFLQERCTAPALANALRPLLADRGARDALRAAVRPALEALGLGGPPPSLRAARAVLAAIDRGPASRGTYTRVERRTR